MSVVARMTDRVRPWRSPPPPTGAPTAAVIGAGAAGLATAALLRREGIDATVLDRAEAVGGSWPGRYDSLRLNTVRWMSDLPGRRMPRALGRWVGRDALTNYLRDYADHHRLPCRLGVDVSHIDPDDDRWVIDVGGVSERFGAVVVATGHSSRPKLPDWPGRPSFVGRFLHAADYRDPTEHVGRRVLVVGAGSSGGEICVDLARAGIEPQWSVGTAPRLFPREVLHLPATPVAPIVDVLPDRLVDRIAPRVERAIWRSKPCCGP